MAAQDDWEIVPATETAPASSDWEIEPPPPAGSLPPEGTPDLGSVDTRPLRGAYDTDEAVARGSEAMLRARQYPRFEAEAQPDEVPPVPQPAATVRPEPWREPSTMAGFEAGETEEEPAPPLAVSPEFLQSKPGEGLATFLSPTAPLTNAGRMREQTQGPDRTAGPAPIGGMAGTKLAEIAQLREAIGGIGQLDRNQRLDLRRRIARAPIGQDDVWRLQEAATKVEQGGELPSIDEIAPWASTPQSTTQAAANAFVGAPIQVVGEGLQTLDRALMRVTPDLRQYWPALQKYQTQSPEERAVSKSLMEADKSIGPGAKQLLRQMFSDIEEGYMPEPLRDLPKPGTVGAVGRAGAKVVAGAQHEFPLAPQQAEGLMVQAAGGLGSLLPAIPLGAAGAGVLFGMAGAQQAYERAKAAGATEQEAEDIAMQRLWIDTAANAVPIHYALKPFGRAEGFVPWAVAKLASSGRSAGAFATAGEVQYYLQEELQKKFEKEAGYKFDINRFGAAALVGALFGSITPSPVRRPAARQEGAPRPEWPPREEAPPTERAEQGTEEGIPQGTEGTVPAGEETAPPPPPRPKTPTERVADSLRPEEPEGDGTRANPVVVRTADDLRRADANVVDEPGEKRETGHLVLHDTGVTVETAKGGIRRGTAPDGTAWEAEAPATYGSIDGTKGKDGDPVDISIGDKPESTKAWVVDQYNPETGKFDEHKVQAGVETQAEAIAQYDAGFSDGSGPARRGAVTETTLADATSWAKTGDTSRPFAETQAPDRQGRPLEGDRAPDAATGRPADAAAEQPAGAADSVSRETLDRHQEVIDRNYPKVRAFLDRLGLGAVAAKLQAKLEDPSAPGGVDGRYYARLIEVAADQPEHNILPTAAHEAMHALDDLGIIPDADWAALMKPAIADYWRKRYGVDKEYTGYDPAKPKQQDLLRREAVSHAFADFLNGKLKVYGVVKKVFERLRDVLDGIRHGFTQAELKAARKVMDDVLSGKMVGLPERPGVHRYREPGAPRETTLSPEPALSRRRGAGEPTPQDREEALDRRFGRTLPTAEGQRGAALREAALDRRFGKDRAETPLDREEALDRRLGRVKPTAEGQRGAMAREAALDREGEPMLARRRGGEPEREERRLEREAAGRGEFQEAVRRGGVRAASRFSQASWEAVPSEKVAHLKGVSDLPPKLVQDYHRRVNDAMLDRDGSDRLAKVFDVASPGDFEAPGFWQGKSNASQQTLIRGTTPAAINRYNAARGLITKQDGVGWHRPVFTPKLAETNGVVFRTSKPLTREQVLEIGNRLSKAYPDAAPIPSPDGLRVVNFDFGATDHGKFRAAAERVTNAIVGDDIRAKIAYFKSDGDLVGNDWAKEAAGEGYIKGLGLEGRPDVYRAVRDILARAARAEEAFAEEHGLEYTDVNRRIRAALKEAAGKAAEVDDGPMLARRRAGWDDERLDREIARTAAGDTSKAMVAWINPKEFLRATTGGRADEALIRASSTPLDVPRLRAEEQTPFVYADLNEDGSARIRGHEGRHRMVALAEAGVDRVPLVVDFRQRREWQPIEKLKLEGQYRESLGDLYAEKLIPLTAKYRDEISAAMADPEVMFARRPEARRADAASEEERISTRVPYAKGKGKVGTEDALAGTPLQVGLESAKAAPASFAKNTKLIEKYPNYKPERGARTPEAIAERFVSHVKDNLLWLYDQVDPAIRNRSKLWYDGAQKLAKRWAKEFDLPERGIAGVIASMSPQRDWFQNVSLARRVLGIMRDHLKTPMSPEMRTVARRIYAKPKLKALFKKIDGKQLGELTGDFEKAAWLRLYDEAHNDKSFQLMSPEGEFLGPAKTKAGKNHDIAWGSLDEIAKAISAIENPSRVNLSTRMGGNHKVRSFFNNIIAPKSRSGDVTIDTHAVAAALLRPLSGNTPEVAHSMGLSLDRKYHPPEGFKGASKNAKTGNKGVYGIYAEAYRRAAAERGVLPREMQSITWEAIRGMFSDVYKRNKGNVAYARRVWDDYRNGRISLDAARQQIITHAGGIEDPAWVGVAARGVHAAGRDRADAGELSGAGLPGGRAGGGEPGAAAGDRGRGGRGGLGEEPLLARRRDEAPTFFSALTRAVAGIPQPKAPAGMWRNIIGNLKGVKQEEVKWSGVIPWLEAQQGKPVSKAEIEAFLRENELVLEEVTSATPAEVEAEFDRRRDIQNAALAAADDFRYGWNREDGREVRGRRTGVGEVMHDLIDGKITPDDLPEDMRALGRNYVEWRLEHERIGGDDPEARLPKWGTDSGYRVTYPGGKNYREMLIKLPVPKPRNPAEWKFTRRHLAPERDKARGTFTHPHWRGEENVLAHIRFDERMVNGERVLFIQEIQSDWHQIGREKGYQGGDLDRLATRPLTQEQFDRVHVAEQELFAAANRDLEADPSGGKTQSYHDAYKNLERVATEEAIAAGLPGDIEVRYDQRRDQYRIRYKVAGHLPRDAAWGPFNAAILRAQDAINQLRQERSDAGVPDAPFKTTWHELVLKRALRLAADEGFDRVAWTSGEMQAERYDQLVKGVAQITYRTRKGHDTGTLEAYDKAGSRLLKEPLVKPEAVKEHLGKELADKLFATSMRTHPKTGDTLHSLEGDNITIGGEGMKGFYNKMLPNFAGKYVKQWGSKVEPVAIGQNPYTVQKVADGYGVFAPDGSRTDRGTTFPTAEAALNAAAGFNTRGDDRYRIIYSSDAGGGGYRVVERGDATRDTPTGDLIFPTRADAQAWIDQHGTETVPSVPVTDAMREGVMAGQPMMARRPEPKPTFFSALTRAVTGIKQPKAPAGMWRNMLGNLKGVKQEELKWSGVIDWLESKQGQTVTREEVEAFVKQNELQVEEVVKQDTDAPTEEQLMASLRDQWSIDQEPLGERWEVSDPGGNVVARRNTRAAAESAREGLIAEDLRENPQDARSEFRGTRWGEDSGYGTTLPGGENYRELLIKMPARKPGPQDRRVMDRAIENARDEGSAWEEMTDAQREPYLRDARARIGGGDTFRSSHWDEENVLAHIRFDERMVGNKKVLFIQEIQSDWHQAGREKGYREGAAPQMEQVQHVILSATVRDRIHELAREVGLLPRTALMAARSPEKQAALNKLNDYAQREALAAGMPENWSLEMTGNGWQVFDGISGGRLATSQQSAGAALLRAVDQRNSALRSEAQHEQGRKVPDAPFKTTWHELAFKRALRWAAEHGYDNVAWTPGEMQNQRYNLERRVSKLQLKEDTDRADGTYFLQSYDNEGLLGTSVRVRDEAAAAEHVGADLANRLFADMERRRPETDYGFGELSGLDLKTGGEGMRGFYDKMLPAFANKYGKQWGSRVEPMQLVGVRDRGGVSGQQVMDHLGRPVEEWRDLSNEERDRLISEYRDRDQNPVVHSMPVTDEMRASVLEEGQPMLSRRRRDEPFWEKVGLHDRMLRGEAGRAVNAWVGGDTDFAAHSEVGVGTFSQGRLEDAYSAAPSERGKVIRNEIEAAAEPIREELRKEGPTVRLYRSQRKLDESAEWRNLLSYTDDPNISTWFAGESPRPYKVLTDEQLRAAAAQFEATGKVDGLGHSYDRTDPKYADIIDRDGQVVTDTDIVTSPYGRLPEHLLDANKERIADNARRLEALDQRVITRDVPVDDVVWVTDRFNQREFIVKNQAKEGEMFARRKRVKPQRQVRAYRTILDRVRSKIGEPDVLQTNTDDIFDNFRQWSTDDLHGLLHMERELNPGLRGSVPAGAYETSRLMRGKNGVIEGALTLGVPTVQPDGSVKFVGKGLKQVLAPVGRDLDNYTLYAVGRSARELFGQGRENLFTDAEIKAMEALETPLFRKVFDDYQTWNKGVLDFTQARGAIDPAKRALWRRAQYMPFHRVQQGGSFEQVKGDFAGIKALTGGTGNIRDVLHNMVSNARMLIDAAITNEARAAVVEEAKKPGGDLFLRQIDRTSRKVAIDEAQIAKAIEDALGASNATHTPARQQTLDDIRAAMAPMVEFWMHAQAPAGNDVFAVMRGGKPEYYQVVDPLLLRSIQAFQRPAQSALVRVLGFPKRLAHKTIVLDASFMAANLGRDTLLGSIMSNVFRAGVDTARGFKSRVMRDESYRNYIANGGGLAGQFLEEGSFRKHMDAYYAKRGINPATVLNTARRLLHGFEQIGDAFELATRLGEYKRQVELGAHPREAAYRGREISTDFGMRGDSEVLGFFYDTVVFLKAAMNGLDRVYRGVVHDPNRASIAAKTAALAMASAGLAYVNYNNPLYQQLEDHDRDGNWHFFIPTLGRIEAMYNGSATPVEQMDKAELANLYTHFRFPKMWEIGLMSTLAERTVHAIMTGEYGENAKAALKAAITVLVPGFGLPTTTVPFIEATANRSFFTGSPIEGKAEEALEPWARASETTSPTFRKLGELQRDLPRALQVSPAKMEHIFRSFTNGWGAAGLTLIDGMTHDMPDKRLDEYPVLRRFFQQEPAKSNRYVREFYELLRDTTEARRTIARLTKRGDDDLAEELELERGVSGPRAKGAPAPKSKEPLLQAQKDLKLFREEIDEVRRETKIDALQDMIRGRNLTERAEGKMDKPGALKLILLNDIRKDRNERAEEAVKTLKPMLKEAQEEGRRVRAEAR